MAKKRKKTATRQGSRPRRGLEQRIAELDAQLNALRQRIAAKRNPALKHALAACKELDKALEVCEETGTRRALSSAREILTGVVGAAGSAGTTDAVAPRRGRRAGGAIEPDALLAHVQANPGQRGEQISQALGVDTRTLRPVMKRLIEAGQVATAGQRRGMTYTAVRG
jgi:type II secretory pathway component HofQ